MTSLMTRAATLFLCWVMIAQCVDAEEYTEKIQRFLDFYTGKYDNANLRDVVGKYIQVRIELVSAPELKAPVIYIEQSIDGHAVLILACEVDEITGQDAIKLTPYNVTDASRYTAYEFDTLTLVDYDRSAFQEYKGCPSDYYWRPIGQYYTGLWTDCRTEVDGKHPKYAVTVDCLSFTLVTTLAQFNIATDVPYFLNRLDSSPC